ncbi:hypothetical protein Tco_0557119 [Tanacetum coccineum]
MITNHEDSYTQSRSSPTTSSTSQSDKHCNEIWVMWKCLCKDQMNTKLSNLPADWGKVRRSCCEGSVKEPRERWDSQYFKIKLPLHDGSLKRKEMCRIILEELMTQTWMKAPMMLSLSWPICSSSSATQQSNSYLDEIVCLKNANKVARDMLQRFNMPTQTIPMLSKKPKAATADLHKALLEVLVHQVVSMKKMNEKPGHVRPANGFYDKLNALKFVPQQELSREQAYWLPANERASQTSNPNSPVTPFAILLLTYCDTEKVSALTAENTMLKAQVTGLKQVVGPSTSGDTQSACSGCTT